MASWEIDFTDNDGLDIRELSTPFYIHGFTITQAITALIILSIIGVLILAIIGQGVFLIYIFLTPTTSIIGYSLKKAIELGKIQGDNETLLIDENYLDKL